MINSEFCHLHIHNEFSYLDGYGTADQWAKAAAEMGFGYLALTNHSNVDGCIRFQTACDKVGINPIIGCELYIVQDFDYKDKPGHILLLVENKNGWNELLRLLSIAHGAGFYRRPRVRYEDILSADLSGLIISTACVSSFMFHIPGWDSFMIQLMNIHRGSLVLEVMPHVHAKQAEYHQQLLNWNDGGPALPLLATNDAHYIMEDDETVQEILLSINTGAKWNDPNRFKFDFHRLHLKSANEMIADFRRQGQLNVGEYMAAMDNTLVIAQRCSDFRIPKGQAHLPNMAQKLFNFKDSGKQLITLCQPKVDEMVESGIWREDERYGARFLEEFTLITKRDFADYFLVVWRIIQWCEENDIMVGPGRGSVGGCLIAYLLGITKVDPIEHNLSFSRFISEDRIDFPDIDLDFEKEKRHLVLEFIQSEFGLNHVAGISSFSTLNTRGAIRDIGRIFEIETKRVDAFAKAISYRYDNFEEVMNGPIGQIWSKDYPEATQLITRLKGQIRGTSQHAAGVVISAKDLTDGDYCYLKPGKELPLINWDGRDSEYVGLLKLDILGLAMLSVLNRCDQLIYMNHDVTFDFDQIPFDDPEVFKQISAGNTAGAFQIMATPTMNLCMEMGVECFEDIVAAVALVRPGPKDSGMTAEYIARKKGKPRPQEHPIYELITRNTFGLLAYQEQVMRVIADMAGLSETIADKIRKVIGKKRDAAEFEPYRIQFMEGCAKQGTFNHREAAEFWDGLLKWGNYGFNRAHSVEYAILGYWCMWLKIYYPAEYLSAYLTYGEFDEDVPDKSKQRIVDEVLRLGYRIMPPKIGISDACLWVIKDDKFYMPFTELKGVGECTADKCCEWAPKIQQGFFNLPNSNHTKDKAVDDIMTAIDANDPESIPDDISDYILGGYNILGGNDPYDRYPKLMKTLGFGCDMETVKKIMILDPEVETMLVGKDFIHSRRYRENGVKECRECSLRNECTAPVLSSMGKTNAVILCEAPGFEEDQQSMNLVGPAGNVLWKEIAKHYLSRTDFHTINCCRCYPSQIKNPKKEHVEACRPWLQKEISGLQTRLVLACGNIPLLALTGQSSGITELSGTTQWLEQWGFWVCWCVHPSSVLRRGSNREKFELGIANFAQKFSMLQVPF